MAKNTINHDFGQNLAAISGVDCDGQHVNPNC